MTVTAQEDKAVASGLLPVLTHVQTNLDGDLSLSALAGIARRSPSHLHRVFRQRIGETPRRYVERLRLEQAALRLSLLRTSVLDVALAVGFQSHETFTRAFRRHFGVPPREIRKNGVEALALADNRGSDSVGSGDLGEYSLSKTRIVELAPMHLAFIRRLGPYEDVDPSIFDDLQEWARRRLGGYRPLLGIGHDPPGITPPEKLRFDAAVKVDGPFPAEGGVGHQRLAVGWCAMTTHVGSYATLPRAYEKMFGRVMAMKRWQPRGVPAVEIYHERKIDVSLRYNHTDVYLPVG